MVRIGILGSGFMATVHALRYGKIDGVEVTAVASPSGPTEFVDKYTDDATVYNNALEMYDSEPLDAVDICTPTNTHNDLVVPAIERGLDVLCEKPIERTIPAAQAIADAAANVDATVMPGHTIRFFPEYAKARERIQAGDVGSPGNVRTLRQSPFEKKSDWFIDSEKSDGVLLDLAIHDFDFLRWTIGEVDRVFARRQQWDTHEYALTTIRFENDVIGHVDARWPQRSDLPFVSRFEIAGDEGLLEFDSEEVNAIDIVSTTATDKPDRDPIDEPLETDPYLRELETFVDCVRTGMEPPITIDDGIKTLRVALAALESAECGEPVVVSEAST